MPSNKAYIPQRYHVERALFCLFNHLAYWTSFYTSNPIFIVFGNFEESGVQITNAILLEPDLKAREFFRFQLHAKALLTNVILLSFLVQTIDHLIVAQLIQLKHACLAHWRNNNWTADYLFVKSCKKSSQLVLNIQSW